MLFNFAEIGTLFLLGARAIALLYMPGILVTLLVWKGMRWDERIAISPFFSMMVIIFGVRLLKMIGVELVVIPQAQILAGLTAIIFACVFLIICLIRKQRKA